MTQFRLMSPPRISNHAMLRFLERILGIDIEDLRARLLTPAVIEVINTGATAVIIEDMTLVIESGVIVTILGPGQFPTANKQERIVSIEDTDLKQLLRNYRDAIEGFN